MFLSGTVRTSRLRENEFEGMGWLAAPRVCARDGATKSVNDYNKLYIAAMWRTIMYDGLQLTGR